MQPGMQADMCLIWTQPFDSETLTPLRACLPCSCNLTSRLTSRQAHVACLALEEILHAMAVHQRVANVQAKGLIVLGVLGQARGSPLIPL